MGRSGERYRPAMPLEDYTADTFAHQGKERRVFRRGEGPAVIVIAEVPGITPEVVAFADRVAAIGCTAVLPHLFGEPGKEESALYATNVIAWACVSREFSTWATGCGRWPATSTSAAAGPGSAPSACASRAGSPWP